MSLRTGFALASVLALVGFSIPFASAENPPLVLSVVRLKPGETRVIEFALPGRLDFRPAGRSGRDHVVFSVLASPARAEREEPDQQERIKPPQEVPGLELRWDEVRSAVSFRAAKDAAAGAHDFRITYRSFS